MRTLLISKKFLLLALFEDIILILFLFALIASGLEILLPNILAQRIPLAFVFTALAITTTVYLHWLRLENIPLPSTKAPRALTALMFVLLVFVSLFMARGFGVLGALVQVIILSVILWFWSRN